MIALAGLHTIIHEFQREEVVDTQMLSISLGIVGPMGLLAFLLMAGTVTRWHIRNLRLKQISAIASLFCLAMAGSYGIIQEAWALIYLIIAFKTATWWVRITISQRS